MSLQEGGQVVLHPSGVVLPSAILLGLIKNDETYFVCAVISRRMAKLIISYGVHTGGKNTCTYVYV